MIHKKFKYFNLTQITRFNLRPFFLKSKQSNSLPKLYTCQWEKFKMKQIQWKPQENLLQ